MTAQRQRTFRFNLFRGGRKIASFIDCCEWELALILSIELDQGVSRCHTVTLGCNASTYWTILEPGDRLCAEGEADSHDEIYYALCARIEHALENENPHH